MIPPLPDRPALLANPDLDRYAFWYRSKTDESVRFTSWQMAKEIMRADDLLKHRPQVRRIHVKTVDSLNPAEVAKLARNIWKELFGFEFPY